jgi:hypothetical protein
LDVRNPGINIEIVPFLDVLLLFYETGCMAIMAKEERSIWNVYFSVPLKTRVLREVVVPMEPVWEGLTEE